MFRMDGDHSLSEMKRMSNVKEILATLDRVSAIAVEFDQLRALGSNCGDASRDRHGSVDESVLSASNPQKLIILHDRLTQLLQELRTANTLLQIGRLPLTWH